MSPSSDEAVSPIIAAVLVFALFSASFLLWTLNTQPEWVADREHQHLVDFKQGLGNLQAGLEALSATGDLGPITQTFSLAAEPLAMLQPTANTGSLSIQPGFKVSASFASPEIFVVDGVRGGNPTVDAIAPPSFPAPGTAPSGPTSFTDATALQVLEIAMTTPSSGGSTLIIATDAQGSQARVEVRHVSAATGCSGWGIDAKTSGPLGDRFHPISCQSSAAALVSYPVDVLESRLGFAGAVKALSAPFTLYVMEGSGADSKWAAAWTDSAGRPNFAGTGSTPGPSYDVSLDGDYLEFNPGVQRFPDQTVALQGGAIVVTQGDKGAVTRAPTFDFDMENGVGYLRWTVVSMTGKGAVSSSGSGSVVVSHLGTQSILMKVPASATADSFITIESPDADHWATFFSDQILFAGAGSLFADSTEPTQNTAQMNLKQGTEWIIELRVIQASMVIQ